MKICKVVGCDKSSFYKDNGAKGYCQRHYKQIEQYGKILLRTIYDPNEIICKGKICEIVLYNNKSEEVARAIIDREDRNKIEGYKWHLDNNGYVATWEGKKLLYLHHLILPRKKGLLNDHQFGNPLDNRKSNLRYATHTQNSRNRRNVKGFYFNKKLEKFQAEIRVDGKSIHLGFFGKDDAEGAKKAYREATLKYFGEFAFGVD